MPARRRVAGDKGRTVKKSEHVMTADGDAASSPANAPSTRKLKALLRAYQEADSLAGVDPLGSDPEIRALRKIGLTAKQIIEVREIQRGPEAECDFTAADYMSTDLGLARRFTLDHRHVVRHVAGRGWLAWSGRHWQDDEDGQAVRLMKTTVICLLDAAEAKPFNSQARKDLFKFALRSESHRAITAALHLAESEKALAVTSAAFDVDPWLFNAWSGTVDLKTGELRPHRQADMLSTISPVAYRPDAACPRWLLFLSEIFGGDDELIGFVRRAVGYTLTGDTSEQCFFVLHGSGANGKSVFLSALRHVFGPYAFDPGFGVFESATRFSPHPEQLAALAGRRFITACETAENTRLNEQRLKVLSHGDATSARHMYGRRFEFTPTGKIWLAVNHKPRVNDDSLGFWRSVRLVPFEQEFVGPAADPRLLDKLKAEAEGILAWAVRGCLEWQREGLRPPDAVLLAGDDWRGESDSFQAFLLDCCTLGQHCSATARDLFGIYCRWAKSETLPERDRLTRTGFGRRLGKLFDRGTGRPRTYFGVGLASGCLTEIQT